MYFWGGSWFFDLGFFASPPPRPRAFFVSTCKALRLGLRRFYHLLILLKNYSYTGKKTKKLKWSIKTCTKLLIILVKCSFSCLHSIISKTLMMSVPTMLILSSSEFWVKIVLPHLNISNFNAAKTFSFNAFVFLY